MNNKHLSRYKEINNNFIIASRAYFLHVRLHDPTDPCTERTTPPRSAHVQLGDVPRTLDTAEAEGEFRQHDGVVTVMMMLPTHGFA